MSFELVEKVMCIGGASATPPAFQFYKRGFVLGGTGEAPSWQDIILHGRTALSLVNAKADSLEYLKLFGGTEQLPETYLDTVTLSGGCEQSGTPTPDTPIDIVCNNGAIKVSPNLLNNPTWQGGYIREDGTLDINAGTHLSFYPVRPNTTYTFTYTKGNANSYYDRIAGYSSNTEGSFIELLSQKDFRNNAVGSRLTSTFTTGINTNYIRIGCFCGNLPSGTTPTDAQLEQGTTATTYMPYGQIYVDGTQEVVTDSVGNTASAERLLAVGDYKDTQEVLSGSVTRNIGIKVFDGTETGWVRGANSLYIDRLFDDAIGYSADNPAITCSHFKGFPPSTTVSSMPDLSAKLGASNQQRRVYFVYDAITTVEQFQQFLADQYKAGTPVIVAYPLETATTSTVTQQLLLKSPVTQTAGSISNLPIAITESQKTVPSPQQPLQINCNNGVLKIFSGNKFTTEGATDGYIISVNTGEITSNSVYTVTDYINLKAGNYEGTFRSSSSAIGNRYFRCWSYKADGTPIEEIFNIKEIVGTQTFTFNLANDALVRMSYNNDRFSDMDVHPTDAIIYADGTTETVEIHGKNLINVADLVYKTDKYLDNSGVEQSYSGTNYTKMYYPVLPNTTYTVSGNFTTNNSYITGIYFFDSNKQFVSRNTNDSVQSPYPRTITTPANCRYVDFQYRNTAMTSTWQMELGSTATDYEPYFNGGTATAENLFKIGTYQDVQSVIDGGVTRNIGVMVLDGTEGWVSASISDLYYFVSSNIKYDSASPALCSHYACELPSVTGANMGDKRVKVGYTASGTHDRVYIKDSSFADVSSLTTWLASQYSAGNPVIIVYPLLELTTETVTGQPMNIQEGTNIVQITQASMDDLELEVKYKATI